MRARALGSFGVALVAVALIGVTFATDGRAQPVPGGTSGATGVASQGATPTVRSEGYQEAVSDLNPNGTWFGVSGGVNAITTKFEGRGSAFGTTGVVCLDAEQRWGSNLRYAGEFSGFRLAVTGSVCEGFDHSSQTVDGFIGQTSIGTQLLFGGKIGYPLLIPSTPITLYVVGGLSYTDLTVKAVPFESGSKWVVGSYIGGEASISVSELYARRRAKIKDAGYENVEVYMNALFDPLKLTLSGGAHTSTTMMVYKIGLRARY